MLASDAVPVAVAALVIGALVVLLASTRKSLSGPDRPIGDGSTGESKYPSGFWMSVGLIGGITLGVPLGFVVHSLLGGIFIGIGIGLILGKWLDRRFDKDTTQYTEEQKQVRLRRATWGLIMMILLVLGTLLAALLPLLD